MSSIVICTISSFIAGGLGFLAGIRAEKGSQEVKALLREEEREVRGRRGTVRLNAVRVRR